MPLKDIEWTHPRKDQTCIGCGETIPAGVRCQSLLKKDRKHISRHYLCERCAYAATNKVMASGGEAIEITPGCFSWDKLNNKFCCLRFPFYHSAIVPSKFRQTGFFQVDAFSAAF